MGAAAERTATCLEHRSAVNYCRGSTPPASVFNLEDASEWTATALEPQGTAEMP